MALSLIYTAFIPEQESRQSRGKYRESNPETDVTPQCQVCVVLSWAYHIHWGSNGQQRVQISQAIKKNFQTSTKGWMLSATRQGEKSSVTAGDSSWDKAEERTEHAGTNLRCLTAALCYAIISKATTTYVIQQTALVFQLSSTVARKCKLLLRDEEIRGRILCPIFKCPATCQCLTRQICTTLPGLLCRYGGLKCTVYRDDRHVWTNLTTLRYKSHQVFWWTVWLKNKIETSFKINCSIFYL